MISLVPELPAADGESAALARIKCTFSAYGSYPQLALFWQQKSEADNNLSSIICLFNSHLTVWSKNPDNELREFILAVDAVSCFTDAPSAAALGISGKTLCAVKRFSALKNCLPSMPELPVIYDIFSRCFDIGDRNTFIADISHRLRHNCAAAAVEGASAAFIQKSDDAALITGVAVDENHRRRGIGSTLLNRITCFEKEIPVYACCEDSLLPFYLKNGFSEITPCVITERKK